jgi:hypothetical protein
VRPLLLDGREDFLLLACDGLFDVMSAQEAVNYAVAMLSKCKNDPAAAAHALARHAVFDLRSSDNVSVLIVLFRDVGASPPPAPPAGQPPLEPPPPYGPPAAPMPEPPAPKPEPPAPKPAPAAEPVAKAVAVAPSSSQRSAVFKAGAPLGLQLGTELKTGLLRISNLFEGGAADVAGLKKHDCVVGIAAEGDESNGGEDTRLVSHEEATSRIKEFLSSSGGVRVTVETTLAQKAPVP